jgi:hypothetical protein
MLDKYQIAQNVDPGGTSEAVKDFQIITTHVDSVREERISIDRIVDRISVPSGRIILRWS